MAKGIIAQLLVNVTSKGAGKTKAEIEGVSKAATGVSNSYATAAAKGKNFFNAQEKGIIGTANSTKSFSKLAQTINGGGSSSVVAAYATLMANVFSLTAAFNALKGAAQIQQIEQGLTSLGTRMGSTLTLAAKEMKELTGNTLTTEQSMRSAAQVFSAGFDAKTLKDLTAVARDASFVLGRDMTDSLDRITRGVIKLEPELLDELGIMTRVGEATAVYAHQLGKAESALSTTERRQAFLNAVVAEGTAKYAGLSDQVGNLRAWDQLGSTFNNLVKDLLNGINAIALPVAQFFASSPTSLLGGMVLFAGTIKSQMLPGLASLQQRNAAVAETYRDIAEAQTESLAVQRDALREKRFDAFAQASGLQKIEGMRSNSAYHKLVRELDNDNFAVLDDKDAVNSAVKSLDKSLASAIKTQAGLNVESEKYAVTQQKINSLTTARTALTSGLATEKALTAELLANKKELLQAERNLQVTSQTALAHSTAGTALEAAQVGKYRTSIVLATQAVREFAVAQNIAAGSGGALGKMMGTVRTGAFAAATAVRVLGVAFMNMIPVIGTIIAVIGMIIAGFKALKPDSVKKQEEAMAKLGEVTSTLADKTAELDRIQNSAMNSGLKYTKSLQIQANVYSELSERLEAIRQLRVAEGKGDTGAEAKKVFKGFMGFSGKEVKSMREMYGFVKAANPEIIEMLGGYEGLAKLGKQGAFDALGRAIEEQADKTEKLHSLTVSLTESLKSAGTAYAALVKGAIGTTTVDGVVQGLSESLAAIKALNERGESVGAGSILETMDADSMKMLSAATRLRLQETQAIEEAEAAGIKATAQQRNYLLMMSRRRDFQKVTGAEIEKELTIQKQLAEVEQSRQTLANSQAALVTATLSKYRESYSMTVAGVKRQMELENQVIQIKMDELKYSQLMLQTEVEMQKLAIENLKNLARERADLVEIRKEKLEILSIGERSQLSELKRQRAEVENAKYSESIRRNQLMHIDRQIAGVEARVRVEEQLLRQAEAAQREEDANMQAAISSLTIVQNQATAVGNQIAAIGKGMHTQADFIYATNAKTLEIYQEQAKALTTIKTLMQDTSEAEQNIANLRSGAVRTAVVELANLRNRNKIAKEQQMYEQRTAQAQLQLQITRAQGDAERRLEVPELERRLDLMRAEHSIANAALDVQHRYAEEQIRNVNTQKEGLEYQKQALGYLTEMAELRERERSATVEIAQKDAELARRRAGLKTTEDHTRADEIRAAVATYKSTMEGLEMRKDIIRLEYALLDAQIMETRAKLAGLKAVQEVGSVAYQQLETAIGNLEEVSRKRPAMLEMALALEDKQVTNARRDVELAITPEGRQTSAWDGKRVVREAEQEARSVLAAGLVEPLAETLTPVFDELRSPVEDTTDILTANTELLAKIEPHLKTIAGRAGGATVGSAAEELRNMTPQKLTEMIGKAAQAYGLRVSEHSAFGGVGGHGNGSLHYRDRALDLNVGTNSVEWNKPQERAFMNAFLEQFKAVGGIDTVFNSTDHANHGHLEVDRLAQINYETLASILLQYIPEQFAAAIIEGTSQAAPEIARTIAEEAPVDMGEIVVTASRSATTETAASTSTAAEGINTKLELAKELADALSGLPAHASGLTEIFSKLGPEGEAMNAAIEGIGQFGDNMSRVMRAFEGTNFEEKFVAVADTISSAIGTVGTFYAKQAEAKIAAIDAEIAAEQKRDGKSAESLAKIQAMEAKKEATAKKAFEVNKKLMMAQAVIATATGVTQALGQGGIFGIPMAILIGAMGAAQLALIASTNYQSAASSTPPSAGAQSLTIGKRGDSVDLAKNNANAGGEIGYLRGSQGYGKTASDYVAIGSAYGGSLGRGYGNAAYLVGEQGPEFVVPEVPSTVVPDGAMGGGNNVNATFNINTLDASGVQDILHSQRGFIIGSIREAANANGEGFLENVSTDVYTKPNVGKL